MPKGYLRPSLGLALQAPKLCPGPTKLQFGGSGVVFFLHRLLLSTLWNRCSNPLLSHELNC